MSVKQQTVISTQEAMLKMTMSASVMFCAYKLNIYFSRLLPLLEIPDTAISFNSIFALSCCI